MAEARKKEKIQEKAFPKKKRIEKDGVKKRWEKAEVKRQSLGSWAWIFLSFDFLPEKKPVDIES